MAEIFRESEARKPFVRFERVAFEDKAKSLEAGHYVAVDVDMAYITPPYSKDVMKYKVKNWFVQLEQDMANQRIPKQWVDEYKTAYDYWLRGQEMPLDGIPIKGWGVISPAQQETLIKMHVLTVESLAEMTEEGVRRVGMGGMDLKNKAEAWLKSLKKSGLVTLEMARLKKENENLKLALDTLENKFNTINAQLNDMKRAEQFIATNEVADSITLEDLYDNESA